MKDNVIILQKKAIELGATFAEIIQTKDLVLDIRTSLNCLTCKRYNQKATCPPNIPSYAYFEKIYEKYNYGIMIGMKWNIEKDYDIIREKSGVGVHRLLLKMEKEAFNFGYYWSVCFIGGSCRICGRDKCAPICKNPKLGRIPLEATGVDVVSTCKKMNIDIKFPVDKEMYRIGLLLLE